MGDGGVIVQDVSFETAKNESSPRGVIKNPVELDKTSSKYEREYATPGLALVLKSGVARENSLPRERDTHTWDPRTERMSRAWTISLHGMLRGPNGTGTGGVPAPLSFDPARPTWPAPRTPFHARVLTLMRVLGNADAFNEVTHDPCGSIEATQDLRDTITRRSFLHVMQDPTGKRWPVTMVDLSREPRGTDWSVAMQEEGERLAAARRQPTVFAFGNGRFSVRGSRSIPPCLPLAASFGGGGHRDACGFRVK